MTLPDPNYSDATPSLKTHVAVLTVAFFLFIAFQTFELIQARFNLSTLHGNQDAAVQQGQKLRAQLEALAQGTLQLSNQGDTAATTIVENLRKQGVTINPPPAVKK